MIDKSLAIQQKLFFRARSDVVAPLLVANHYEGFWYDIPGYKGRMQLNPAIEEPIFASDSPPELHWIFAPAEEVTLIRTGDRRFKATYRKFVVRKLSTADARSLYSAGQRSWFEAFVTDPPCSTVLVQTGIWLHYGARLENGPIDTQDTFDRQTAFTVRDREGIKLGALEKLVLDSWSGLEDLFSSEEKQGRNMSRLAIADFYKMVEETEDRHNVTEDRRNEDQDSHDHETDGGVADGGVAAREEAQDEKANGGPANGEDIEGGQSAKRGSVAERGEGE